MTTTFLSGFDFLKLCHREAQLAKHCCSTWKERLFSVGQTSVHNGSKDF